MAQRRRESPVSYLSGVRPLLAATVFACLIIFAAGETLAQRGGTGIGGRSPNVFVDLSVLDSLGPAPNVPQILQPGLRQPRMPDFRSPARRGFVPAPPSGKIVLKPPSRGKARATKRRTAKKRRAQIKQPQAPKIASRKPRVIQPAQRPPPPPRITQVDQKPLPPKRTVIAPKAPTAPSMARAKARASVTPATPPRIMPRPVTPPLKPVVRPVPPPMKAKIARIPAPTPPPGARSRVAPRPFPAKPARPVIAGPKSGTQTAALPPQSGKFGPGRTIRLGFKAGGAKLSGGATKQLDTVIGGLKREASLRLQLMAYADGNATSASQSRRLSLSRALAVRSYLIEKGVRSTRIDVRALGNKFEGGPPDRVDVIVTNR